MLLNHIKKILCWLFGCCFGLVVLGPSVCVCATFDLFMKAFRLSVLSRALLIFVIWSTQRNEQIYTEKTRKMRRRKEMNEPSDFVHIQKLPINFHRISSPFARLFLCYVCVCVFFSCFLLLFYYVIVMYKHYT